MTKRILSRNELASLAKDWRHQDKRVVFTNGCFDILHAGHIQTLTRARAEGDCLVVGLNSDASVRRLKGPERPVNTEKDRAIVLSALRCVDYVVIFEEDTPVETLEVLRPRVHVKGGDYRPEDLPEAAIVKSYGGEIVIIDLVAGKSTTGIIEKTRQS